MQPAGKVLFIDYWKYLFFHKSHAAALFHNDMGAIGRSFCNIGLLHGHGLADFA
jgi:hypothetical protein